MIKNDENQLLARATLVTSLGDFVSFFAVLVLIHQISGSVVLASYSVAVKSLGIAAGGFILPRLLSTVRIKRAMVGSQLMSFVLMLALMLMTLGTVQPWLVLLILFLQTVLKQVFEGARETYSKGLGSTSEQRSLQAQLLHGFFGAQTIGPVVSFFLLKFLPIQVPLLLDALSFLFAALVVLRLQDRAQEHDLHFSILRPIGYLRTSPALLRIFLLRSVGYWIPVGIFNYLLFSVIQDHYQLDIVNSAWIYAVIGLGSLSATLVLKDRTVVWADAIRKLPDAKLAALALTVLAITRIGFLKLPSLGLALVVIAVGGICNGINVVTTQSLRRKLTTDAQFPEVVGLELVVGRLTDWAVASLFLAAVSHGWLSYETGIWISAGSLVVLAGLHLDKGLEG
jgi:MFS family permease